ncbi:hypothetical protein PMAYCL1PPCAC_31673, partial [Pristionchus mayeri]
RRFPTRYDVLDRRRYVLQNGFFETDASIRLVKQRYRPVRELIVVSTEEVEEDLEIHPVVWAALVIILTTTYTFGKDLVMILLNFHPNE